LIDRSWKQGIRLVAGFAAFIAIAGFVSDVFSGLPVLRSSRSWTAWAVGTAALGLFCLVGEGAGERINARDRVTDPLWRRTGHLALLLALWALFAIGVGGIIWMTR
jgi:hypothetical protein